MENDRIIKIGTCGLFVAFLTPLFVHGYAADTTHRGLTADTIRFFEHTYEDRFNEDEEELIKQGSVDEDAHVRPSFHFYDPVYDRGILGNMPSKRWAQHTKAQARLSPTYLASAGSVALPLFRSDADYSWDRAVYEYVHGDKEYALKALGHIVHLLQDATVPDHTRNDPHPPYADELFDQASPFEHWAGKKFNEENIQVSQELIAEGERPVEFDALDAYFDTLAEYSNSNFFSKDTILHNDYVNPDIDFQKEEDGETFGYSEKEGGYKLVRVKTTKNKFSKEVDNEYFLTEKDKPILTDYWNLLSRQAVQYGAGAMKLFFDAVEEERETHALYEKNKSTFAHIFDKTQASIFGIAKSLYGSSVDKEAFEELNPDAAGAQQGASVAAADIEGNTDGGDVQQEEEQEGDEEDEGEETGETGERNEGEGGDSGEQLVNDRVSEGEEDDKKQDTSEAQNEEESAEDDEDRSDDNTNAESSHLSGPFTEDIPIQGVGGGGSAAAEEEQEHTPEAEQEQENKTKQADTTPPDAPVITTPAATSSVFTHTTVSFAGTAEATSTISTNISNATTTADQNGDWSLTITGLPQSTSTIQFFATDEAGNTSAPATTTVFVDSKVAAPTLLVPACAQSLAESGCLVATTTIVAQWTSQDDDVRHFIVDQGKGAATTTATSTHITTDDPDDVTVSVRAVDAAGNISDPVSKNISVRSNPVVINEVAWMGTHASAFDEWIELYNPTDSDISLENWTLHAGGGSPYIPLSGSISAGGYYLIERTDDNTLASTTADLAVPFSGIDESAGLSNSGQRLALARHDADADATTTIDEIPDCSNWCNNGNTTAYQTMERYDADAPGTDWGNWGTALGAFIKNGKNADGGDINGTPGKRNSISYQIANGNTLTEDKTLTNEHPYIVGDSGFTIDEDTTLSMEKGVVVKFVSAETMIVDGALKTNGTAGAPVVFTAFTDDTYGGDMNGDGDASTPTRGSWEKILFTDTSEDSALAHTIVRYGGSGDSCNNAQIRKVKAAVAAEDTDVSFSNLVAENSDCHGLFLRRSASTITDSSFTFATSTNDAAGIHVQAGAPRITNSTFSENEYGIYMSGAPDAEVADNTFTDNEAEAMYVRGPVPRVSGNSGSGNAVNAITIGHNDNIAEPESTTTLYANNLPYLVVNEAEVPGGAALTFERGVVIKGHTDSGNDLGGITVLDGGRIAYSGNDPTDVIFTSVHDDTVGGAVYESAQSPAPGDWEGIAVEDGGALSLSGFTLRYAGEERGLSPADGLRIETGSGTTTIAHAVIERNKQFGVLAKEGAALEVSDTEIKNHPEDSDVATNRIGLLIQNSTATLTDVSFSNNELDVKAEKGAAATCSGCGAPSTDPPDLLD